MPELPLPDVVPVPLDDPLLPDEGGAAEPADVPVEPGFDAVVVEECDELPQPASAAISSSTGPTSRSLTLSARVMRFMMTSACE